MRRIVRNRLYRILPLVGLGVVGLMLLPGGQPPTANAPRIGLAGDVGPQQVAAAALPATPAPVTAVASISPAPAALPRRAPVVLPVVAKQAVLPVAAPAASPAVLQTTTETSDAAPSRSSGVIGPQAVNGRSGPSTGSSSRFVLAAGEPVQLGETRNGWVHVYRQDGADGWIYGRYLKGASATQSTRPRTMASAAPTTARRPAAGVARVRSPVPVLSAPAQYGTLLAVLEPGERIQVTETRGAWARVVTGDGISGWIPS